MKPTRIKISVSQDGLLPQESVDVATIDFPFIPKKLLRALGFERVDNSTFVGVMPVFVNLDDKEQEIEIELGVSMPEMRKKILELFQPVQSEEAEEPEQKTKQTAKSARKSGKAASGSKSKKTKSTAKKSSGTAKTSKTTKQNTKKKPATKKTTSKRTTSKKTKG